jgi:hypothetical protein
MSSAAKINSDLIHLLRLSQSFENSCVRQWAEQDSMNHDFRFSHAASDNHGISITIRIGQSSEKPGGLLFGYAECMT